MFGSSHHLGLVLVFAGVVLLFTAPTQGNSQCEHEDLTTFIPAKLHCYGSAYSTGGTKCRVAEMTYDCFSRLVEDCLDAAFLQPYIGGSRADLADVARVRDHYC